MSNGARRKLCMWRAEQDGGEGLRQRFVWVHSRRWESHSVLESIIWRPSREMKSSQWQCTSRCPCCLPGVNSKGSWSCAEEGLCFLSVKTCELLKRRTYSYELEWRKYFRVINYSIFTHCKIRARIIEFRHWVVTGVQYNAWENDVIYVTEDIAGALQYEEWIKYRFE